MHKQNKIRLISSEEAGAFDWLWPGKTIEHFNQSWTGELVVNGKVIPFRHGLGRRYVYGRERIHSVTWIANAPRVEGVEADDYERSHSLISLLRKPDKKHVRCEQDIPSGYDGFTIVLHREEIQAPYSPSGLALKIVGDNIAAWATHAAIRAISFEAKY